jgi:hypothetical protein
MRKEIIVEEVTCDVCGNQRAWFDEHQWKLVHINGHPYDMCAMCGLRFDDLQHFMSVTLNLDVRVEDMPVTEEA